MSKTGVVHEFKRRELPGGVDSYDAKTGKVRLRLNVPGSKGGDKRRKTVYVKSWKDIQGEVETFRRELSKLAKKKGNAFNGEIPTIQQYVDEHWEHGLTSTIAASTRKKQESQLKLYILPRLGEKLLTELDNPTLSDYVADLAATISRFGEPISPYTVNRSLELIRKILYDAFDRDIIEEVPFKKRKGGDTRRNKGLPMMAEPQQVRALQRNEYEAFMSGFDDEATFKRFVALNSKQGRVKKSEHFKQARRFGGSWNEDSPELHQYWLRFQRAKVLFLMAFQTGLSTRDLLGLRRDQVRIEEGLIAKNRVKTGELAVIPMSEQVEAELRARLAQLGAADSELRILRDYDGKPYSEVTFRRYFQLAKDLAGITRTFTPRGMRHTFGTLVLSAGASKEVIQGAMGHANPKTTEIYAKLAPSVTKDLREKINSAFRS